MIKFNLQLFGGRGSGGKGGGGSGGQSRPQTVTMQGEQFEKYEDGSVERWVLKGDNAFTIERDRDSEYDFYYTTVRTARGIREGMGETLEDAVKGLLSFYKPKNKREEVLARR